MFKVTFANHTVVTIQGLNELSAYNADMVQSIIRCEAKDIIQGVLGIDQEAKFSQTLKPLAYVNLNSSSAMINAIKLVRTLHPSIGLKMAKDYVDNL